mgnify:CR=1 FL=1
MDRELKHLIKDLRRERLPASVRRNVEAELERDHHARRARSLRFACVVAALLAIVAIPLALQSPSGDSGAGTPSTTMTEAEVIREQTTLSLAYFGKTFQRAGIQSRDKILEVSVPTLRQGLRSAGNAISPTNE